MSKSKTIIFKPEFETKLKKLKIKTKFVKNFNDPKWSNPNITKENQIECLNALGWFIFVVFAFNWKNTQEGQEYWENIANL